MKYRPLHKLRVYLRDEFLTQDCVWQSVGFITWCYSSCGNQTKTTRYSVNLRILNGFILRIRVGVELPTTPALLEKVLKCVRRGHTCIGTQPRVRHFISWGMLLTGNKFVPSWGTGEGVRCCSWLCLEFSYYFF